MAVAPTPTDEVRASELVAALCLATDLGMGFPLEHGLHSTLTAMRIADRIGVDPATATDTYYGCLLLYVGCTADAELAAETFVDGALLEHFMPVVFGAPLETLRGIARALADPGRPAPVRLVQGALRLPQAARGHQQHIRALCEVAQMLSRRLGVPDGVNAVVGALTERWDGKGAPRGLGGDALPLALRIAHVARDATFQGLILDATTAAQVIRRRAGGAFDPRIANLVADEYDDLVGETPTACWSAVLDHEPRPHQMLRGEQIDVALSAMGDFADLVSPYLAGHSSGVAHLAGAAAREAGLGSDQADVVRRAGLVHDLGRVAVAARVWAEPGPLSAADAEQVRLHPYYSERVLAQSPFLARLADVGSHHHERLDGSGYHRGVTASGLSPAQRLLAAADAFHAKTEPRAHREALGHERAAAFVEAEAAAGRLDPQAVRGVLLAAGLRARPATLPAGLTDREAQVVGLLARGLQTKQVARTLGVSVKTADRHIQNAYGKLGVSTRAAATVFAMEHGLVGWGELPMVGKRAGS
jgi:HD-GYP domain-containing protein (c-di-GMP phosphodiesterase class II)